MPRKVWPESAVGKLAGVHIMGNHPSGIYDANPI